MSQRSKSKTSQWAGVRGRDCFWRDAKVAGYRSRAAYKLVAIDDSFRLLKPGFCVVDLGCAPGGWAQVLAQRCCAAAGKTANENAAVNNDKLDSRLRGNDGKNKSLNYRRKSGMVVGVDLAQMAAVDGVVFVRGDFCDSAVVGEVMRHITFADVVVSDMSPNLSGVAVIDQTKAEALAAAAMDFAGQALKENGTLVIKGFEGERFAAVQARMRREYRKVAIFRPPATRAKSREVYVIGRVKIAKKGVE